jgi:hypothetical protein
MVASLKGRTLIKQTEAGLKERVRDEHDPLVLRCCWWIPSRPLGRNVLLHVHLLVQFAPRLPSAEEEYKQGDGEHRDAVEYDRAVHVQRRVPRVLISTEGTLNCER